MRACKKQRLAFPIIVYGVSNKGVTTHWHIIDTIKLVRHHMYIQYVFKLIPNNVNYFTKYLIFT